MRKGCGIREGKKCDPENQCQRIKNKQLILMKGDWI